jgi:tetratricopeptide (TPR) repeat protein
MPQTINGVGTWYYGKRNVFKRRGTCTDCHATADLTSYDTTLYIVVVYLPIVPLGEKRILDECAACQRHRVMKLKEWNALHAEAIEQSNAGLEAHPTEPGPVIAALGSAIAMQHLPQFEAYCEYADAGFPETPEVLEAVAEGRMFFSQWAEAETAFENLIAVRDTPEARERLAVSLLKQLRPDDAQPHLQHIVDGKIGEKTGYLWLLAEAFSAQGRHHEARDMYQLVQEICPADGLDKEFQKRLAQATKLASKGSTKTVASALLAGPAGKVYHEGGGFPLSRVIGPAIIGLLVGLYFWSAISTGQGRKVSVVNGLPIAYTATINGVEVPLQPFSHVTRSFPEGDLAVAVVDPKLQIPAGTATIQTNFWARPFLSKTFLINPDQCAIVHWQKAYYASNPADAKPHENDLRVGQLLHEFGQIDHPFEEFPGQVKVKQGGTTSRTRVSLMLPGPGRGVELPAMMAQAMLPDEAASRVLWTFANALPDSEMILAILSTRIPKPEMIEKLRPRLAERPVLVDWHRFYQNLSDAEANLVPEYEATLAKEPTNPDLMYLLGRIITDPDRELELFTKAAESTPPSSHARHAIGFRSLARGEFEPGLADCLIAVELAPRQLSFQRSVTMGRTALEKWDELIRAETDQFAARGMPMGVSEPMLQWFVWSGREGEGQARVDAWKQLAAAEGDDPNDVALTEQRYQRAVLVAKGDWSTLTEQLALPGAESNAGLEELLFMKRYDAAANMTSANSDETSGPTHLLISLLADAGGEAELAAAQRKAALESLARANRNYRPFHAALAGDVAPDIDELLHASVDLDEKRILLTAVARKFPDSSGPLLELARKLNFQRDMTAHLLADLLGQ